MQSKKFSEFSTCYSYYCHSSLFIHFGEGMCVKPKTFPGEKKQATLLCDMLRSCLHRVTMHLKCGYIYR